MSIATAMKQEQYVQVYDVNGRKLTTIPAWDDLIGYAEAYRAPLRLNES